MKRSIWVRPGREIERKLLSASMLALASLGTVGCSIEKMAVNALADALTQQGGVYASDDDIELVGAASPFGLKTIEGLLHSAPEHRGLLLGAASGFTQYAYVYVHDPMDRVAQTDFDLAQTMGERAKRLYRRARSYGLRGLRVGHPGIEKALVGPDGLREATDQDVPLLYWTAAAWAGEISLSADDPLAVGNLPMVEALLRTAYRLDPDYAQGALHTLMIAFEAGNPAGTGDRGGRAELHFANAIRASAGKQAAPYLSMAENVAIQAQDRDRFVRLLNTALSLDLDAAPQHRLSNRVAQRRARWLLAGIDEYFSE